MFRVIVLGGIAIVGAQACGGSESTSGGDATPSDGAADTSIDTNFPSELPSFIDTGTADSDASVDTNTTPETFPGELPSFIDTGTDTGTSSDGG
jgi:hypothetical protein